MKAGTELKAKFKKLQRRLGLAQWQVVGLLESIWSLTARDAPRGDIGRLSNEDIAATIEWADDEDALIETLVDTGWLDVCDTHRLVVHGWDEHCPTYIRGVLAKQKQEFATSGTKLATKDATKLPTKLPTKDATKLPRPATPDATKYPSGPADQATTKSSLVKPSQVKPIQEDKSASADSSTSVDTTDETGHIQENGTLTSKWLLDAWNERASEVGLKTARAMTRDRTAKARLRLKQPAWPEIFLEALDKLPVPNEGTFQWQPDIDWMIANETNALKIVEGKYDRRQQEAFF